MRRAQSVARDANMRELVRDKDWAGTPLGAAERWPQSLRTLVEICLASRFPAVIFWGPERVQIYNDGYRVILGAKHPRALGQRAAECWAEIWDVIEPMMASVFDSGEAVWLEDTQFSVERSGYLEEAYFTFSYTPVRDESGAVAAIFETVLEVTPQILARRRLAALRELGAHSAAGTIEEACSNAVATFARHMHDLPFTRIYGVGSAGIATLLGHTGVDSRAQTFAAAIALDSDDPWRMAEALETRAPVVLTDLPQRCGPLPGGPWPEHPHSAVVLPIDPPGEARPSGCLIVGVSPRRELDDSYMDFLRLIAQHVSRSFATAHVSQLRRAWASELERANQELEAFSYSVSHDLRAPLRHVTGFAEMLSRSNGDKLDDAGRRHLGKIIEAARHMATLIEDLLSFSRMGRAELQTAHVDLAALVRDVQRELAED